MLNAQAAVGLVEFSIKIKMLLNPIGMKSTTTQVRIMPSPGPRPNSSMLLKATGVSSTTGSPGAKVGVGKYLQTVQRFE